MAQTTNVGHMSAWSLARSRGYTGTREEFAELMASYATVAEQAAESAQSASSSAQGASQAASSANAAMNNALTAESNAQSAASGAQGYAQSAQQSAQSASQSATDAESAKETAVDAVDGFAAGAQQALDSVNSAGINWKSLAERQAENSEAWALGTRDGEDVGSSDSAYHNNAKYYAESVSASAQTATEAAQTATQKASDAQASASAAAESARTLTIDATLTQSGQAADAKAVGDKIDEVKDVVEYIHPGDTVKTDSLSVQRINYWINASGIIQTGNYSIVLTVTPGKTYKISTTFNDGTNYALLKDTVLVSGSAPNYADGYSGRVMVAKNTEAVFTAGSDAKAIIIRADTDAMQNAVSLYEYADLNALKTVDKCVENTTVVQNKDAMRIAIGLGSTGQKLIENSVMRLAYIPCEQNKVYSVEKMADVRFAVMWTKEVPAVNVETFDYISNPEATEITITTGAGAEYLCIYYYARGTSVNTESDLYDSLVVTYIGASAIDRVARALIKSDNDFDDIYIVSKSGKYQTIASAINIAPANSVILIMPGVYEEQIDTKNKNIHLIGCDRETCIILDKSGMYDTPPIEISGGSIQNLTIIETGENSSPSDSGTLPTMAYCIHADWNAMENNSLVISNCILKCYKRATIGFGARNGFKLTVENCDMWSGVQEDTAHDARGAFFGHTYQYAENTSGMQLIMRNNRITCEDHVVACLLDEGGVSVSCDLENNNLYSTVDGVSPSIVKGANNQPVSFSNTLIKLSRCYGNNISVLNNQ